MDKNWITFNQENDEEIIQTIVEFVKILVDRPNHLSVESLQQQKWIVGLGIDEFNWMDAEWVAEAAHSMGHQQGYLAIVEIDTDVSTSIYQIDFTQDALMESMRVFALQNFVILPIDANFVILQEASDYFLVAGKKKFVRQAIGCSFQTSLRMFKDYGLWEDWPMQIKKLMQEVLNRYEPYTGT